MLSEQAKERLGLVFDVAKTIFHIGFMPAVLYLGNYNNKTVNCGDVANNRLYLLSF